jgi:hypothetical protein
MINVAAEGLSLQDINIDDISIYLQNTGWKRREYPESRVIFFDGPQDDKGKSIVLTLPIHKNFQDSNELIARAINLLAAIEHVSLKQIIQQIRSPYQDTLYIRILLSESISPSLEAISHFIHGLRNLVAYSACMEREPRKYFEHPFREAKQQAQHFRFGHTFQGSFGFTIESQVVDTESLWSLLNEGTYLPLERRVIERIARGFLFALEAMRTKDATIISKNYEAGLNANMCNALAEMLKETGDTEIEFSIIWSSWLKPSSDIAAIDSIRLQSNVHTYLEEAAQYLEAVHKADETNLIESAAVKGAIQELASAGPTNRTAKVLSEAYGKVLISIISESEWDKIVCDAYRDKRPISVKGTLARKKRGTWTLVHPRDLIVE